MKLNQKLKILCVAAEVSPFSQVGGLSRGIRYLANSLVKMGHKVKVMSPYYFSVDNYIKNYSDLIKNRCEVNKFNLSEEMASHSQSLSAKILKLNFKANSVDYFFVANDDLFGMRSATYGYVDDFKRFYLFSAMCLEWLLEQVDLNSDEVPDIIHCHDWHTGYLVDLIKNHPRYQKLNRIPVVFTVHNFRYQNQTKLYFTKPDLLDNGKEKLGTIDSEILINQNALARGILFSDKVNTVSPNHATEVLQPEFSYNLVELMRRVANKTSGILNGLDYGDFNPSTDKTIKFNFNIGNAITNKQKNKAVVQEQFGLPVNLKIPLFCYVGRMTYQKGLETLVETIRRLITANYNFQMVALGDGEDYYCELLWRLHIDFPDKVGVKIIHDPILPRQIFAGSDITLVPSNYEPGGIVVLESLSYGSVPLIRKVGGLSDYITSFDLNTRQGNGVSYQNQTTEELGAKIAETINLFNNKIDWNQLMKNGMKYHHDWDKVATDYLQLYYKAILD